MQDAPKAVWSIPYVSVVFFPSLEQNFISYRSSKVSDYIFEIHQLWQSGFSRVYSNCCCSCSFEPGIIQDAPKAVWSIPFVSVAFFLSLKHNFIGYPSSEVSSRPECIFEIHQLWESGFSRVYSNSCCRCSFEPEIIKIGQSSHKMYSNKILNFQESTTILNACTKKVWKLIEGTTYLSYCVHIYQYIYLSMTISYKPPIFQSFISDIFHPTNLYLRFPLIPPLCQCV